MSFRKFNPNKFKPGVPKSVLLFIAGAVWLGIGTLMNGLSYSWLKNQPSVYALAAFSIGFACALLIHHFGFLRIVDKNLGRILPMNDKKCVFSFMTWKSYLLVLIMIFIGILLRHSPIPRLVLAVIYTAIGTALILSSIRYLRFLILTLKN